MGYDTLASLAYNYALQQNLTNPFDTDVVSFSISTVYSAVFAALASTTAYLSLSGAVSPSGTLSRPQNRLFIVKTSALILICLIGFAILSTIWVTFYVAQNQKRLIETADLILGNAILLQGSTDVSQYIDKIKAAN